jgi:transcriptional regulator with XRE-family HTH domain
VRNKSTAVLPITPRSRLASQKAGGPSARIAPKEFGDQLLRGREQKQRSLQEVADATKISIHQLRALERGDLDRLPAGIYRRAIVRQYAEAVGLNVEETVRDLARVSTDVDVDVDVDIESLDAFARRGDAVSSPFTTAWWSSAAALVVLGAAAALATSLYRAGTAAPAAPPVTAASAPTPEVEVPAIALVAATEAVRANAGNIELATEPAVSPRPTPPPPTETDSVAGDATEGELRITSEPSGALVTVNGVGWGPTPVTIRYMPFGKKLIRVTKPGYVSAQRGFAFMPDRRVRSVRMQLSPASPDAR